MTSTAMRFPLTITAPFATGKLFARMWTSSGLRRVKLDDGAAAEREHLGDWHGGGAEHHLDVDCPSAGCDVRGGHRMVSEWLTGMD